MTQIVLIRLLAATLELVYAGSFDGRGYFFDSVILHETVLKMGKINACDCSSI
jgi:hypothetical protein